LDEDYYVIVVRGASENWTVSGEDYKVFGKGVAPVVIKPV